MSAFVVDASMALAWHFPDERSPRAEAVEALSDAQLVIVPRHWFAEVASGMLFGGRRPGSSLEEQARFIQRVGMLNLHVDTLEGADVFERVLPLARAHGLTMYDALYLELAERRGLPLASFDGPLNKAARHVGVELVEEYA